MTKQPLLSRIRIFPEMRFDKPRIARHRTWVSPVLDLAVAARLPDRAKPQ